MTVTGGSTEALTGSIERVTFHNPDNGFAVLRVNHASHLSYFARATSRNSGIIPAMGTPPLGSWPGWSTRYWSSHSHIHNLLPYNRLQTPRDCAR